MPDKVCSRCRESKPLDEFYKHPKGSHGRQSICKVCQNKASTEWAQNNAERTREIHHQYLERLGPEGRAERNRRANYKAAYGITIEEYDRLLTEQGDACAICREPCPSGRRLAVDHDHETGAVRGLLCGPCNIAIGLMRDSLELLDAAMGYLRSHS